MEVDSYIIVKGNYVQREGNEGVVHKCKVEEMSKIILYRVDTHKEVHFHTIVIFLGTFYKIICTKIHRTSVLQLKVVAYEPQDMQRISMLTFQLNNK